MNINSINYN